MPQLIIINGAPAVGKTTIARRLAAQTGYAALTKEDIKEFLFNAVGYSDRDWSRVLGRSATEMLYVFARECLAAGQSVIIENTFWRDYARPTLLGLIEELHCEAIEIYCHTDEEVRMERFRNRAESGERHPGHVDNLATLRDPSNNQPLDIGHTVMLDTTSVADDTFDNLTYQLAQLLR